MADRYWVGGTANWDATAGTKWATTSGGAGGASVPTSADNVFFDAASGAVTVTLTANGSCANIDFTGFTGTITGTSGLGIAGSLTLNNVMGFTISATVTFTTSSTATITSNGKSINTPITINKPSGTISLNDAFNISNATLTVTAGTFTTNNYNVTATQLSSSNSNIRTINLGSSTVTLSSNAAITFTTNTNLTFNAGTSSIVLTASNASVTAGLTTGVTFYNVTFAGTNSATAGIFATNTFNNLTVTGPSSAGVIQLTVDSTQTINGTLSTTGTAGNRRVWFRSSTYGVRQTLTINSAPSLTDADFRDIIVNGTAAPISGTRIGDLRGNSGITFDAPKTVYWVAASGANWSDNVWASTSGGTASTDYFPLPQDTAVFNNSGAGNQLTLNNAITYISTLDFSARTVSFTVNFFQANTIYGNLTLGSGVALTSSSSLTFSGRNTQTITSAGKTFSNSITIDSYGGTVELADALNIGTQTLTVTNGTFDTKSYNVTAGSLSSSNSNVRTIKLDSSTVTLSGLTPINYTGTNLTFNAGTSQVTCTVNSFNFNGGSNIFYNVSFTSANVGTRIVNNSNTFNNLTLNASATGLSELIFSGDQTVNGTLNVSGLSSTQRAFVRSSTLGTTRTITANAISADDCDFRDITIAGSAAGASPTRAGDCGGNSGINFPAPKTVYWNLSGSQNWSATGWASSSGGTPAVNNFPLAQDTAVFDDSGSITQMAVAVAWNIGTVDMSARTSAMTFNTNSASASFYGDWKNGSGTTMSGNQAIIFSGRGTQTITSAGRNFTQSITVDNFSGTVQLADALTISTVTNTLTLTSGTFDAVSYNVTTGLFVVNTAVPATLKMGSGTWTVTGVGTCWNYQPSNVTFYKGTANIVLSDTSTSARTFNGGTASWNKLTIGGTTGTSTLTITGNNQFTELASTKTVAHTIALGTTTQTFGAWTVTGTAGNVVTLTGTGTSHVLAGSCTSGIDYLAMGSIGFAATSPAEFYAGANSTGTATAPVYRTAKPADSTRYWVGGTGNWSDTARWSTSSGGASGASVPRSHDDVVFNSASNATAYTATVNAVTGGIRCKSLTISAPASGNVTLAGSTAIDGIHGNVTLPATGLTRTYSGDITLSGSSTGRTFNTNGVALVSSIVINGVGCEWSLNSALNIGSNAVLVYINGSFNSAGYAITAGRISADYNNSRSIDFTNSTVDLGSTSTINFGTTETAKDTLTFTSSGSQINASTTVPNITGNGKVFNNVSLTSTSISTATVVGENSFNNLSVAGRTSAGISALVFNNNQTINGTLTLSAGTNATMRTFVRSNTIGTTRTLTCNAVTATDIDFRDITIAGSAAPVSGTRLGDCKGNSGITFDAPKTVWWTVGTGGSWGGNAVWALTNGGATSLANFPLAQDTANIVGTSTGVGTVTINAAYNIGTIDMSARTTSYTMTLDTSSNTPTIYGNWINGTGTTLSGTGVMTFAGRGSQTITSAGKTFTQGFFISTPNGSVTLQDAFTCDRNLSGAFAISDGTFDANGYNFSLTGASSSVSSTSSSTRVIAFGSGTWTLAGSSSPWNITSIVGLSVTGTGIISLTSASAKTFVGGGISYSGITLDQGGAGTLTITGNNTFANITNTYGSTGATTIALGSTTQRVGNFGATGTVGKVLTITGNTSNLIYTGGSNITGLDYLNVQGRVYGSAGQMTDIWYAGANSVNSGSLGWIFADGVAPPVSANSNFFLMFG